MAQKTRIYRTGACFDESGAVEGCLPDGCAVAQVVAACAPGQFVMVRLNGAMDPLLRRPLSIAGADLSSGNLTLIYRVVGRGTQQMETLPDRR